MSTVTNHYSLIAFHSSCSFSRRFTSRSASTPAPASLTLITRLTSQLLSADSRCLGSARTSERRRSTSTSRPRPSLSSTTEGRPARTWIHDYKICGWWGPCSWASPSLSDIFWKLFYRIAKRIAVSELLSCNPKCELTSVRVYLNLIWINLASIPPFINRKSVIQNQNWWVILNAIMNEETTVMNDRWQDWSTYRTRYLLGQGWAFVWLRELALL